MQPSLHGHTAGAWQQPRRGRAPCPPASSPEPVSRAELVLPPKLCLSAQEKPPQPLCPQVSHLLGP